MFDSYVWLAEPYSRPAAVVPCRCQVSVESDSPIDQGRSAFCVADYTSECVSRKSERYRIILSQLRPAPSEPRGFGGLLRGIDHPAVHLAPHVTPRGHRIGGGEIRIEFDSFVKEPERL